MAIALQTQSAANIGTTRQTSFTLTAPSGIADGDFLIAVITCNNNTVTVTAPDGTWTQVAGSPFHDAETGACFWKFASGESGNYTFSVGATSRSICGWMGRYTGVDGTTPIDVTPTHTTGGDVPTFTTSVANTMLLVAAWYSAGSGTTATFTPPSSPATFTEEVDQHTTVGTATESSMCVDDLLWSGSGATGTMTISATSGPSACFGLALRPATGGGGTTSEKAGAGVIGP